MERESYILRPNLHLPLVICWYLKTDWNIFEPFLYLTNICISWNSNSAHFYLLWIQRCKGGGKLFLFLSAKLKPRLMDIRMIFGGLTLKDTHFESHQRRLFDPPNGRMGRRNFGFGLHPFPLPFHFSDWLHWEQYPSAIDVWWWNMKRLPGVRRELNSYVSMYVHMKEYASDKSRILVTDLS